MASEQDEYPREEGSSPAIGWAGTLQDQYRKIRENAEAYPYVWTSYILVYGGFALWTTYRFRKLRRTEDRVRVLQERLRKIVDTEESASSSAVSVEKSLPSRSSQVEKSDPAVNDSSMLSIPFCLLHISTSAPAQIAATDVQRTGLLKQPCM